MSDPRFRLGGAGFARRPGLLFTVRKPPAGYAPRSLVRDRNYALQATINLLRSQHEEIAAAVGDLVALFDMRYADAAPILGPARMRIAQIITKHLKTEDELLLTPLREQRLMASIPGCEAIVIETRELRLTYSRHIGTWTARAIEERWSEYVVVTRQLNERLMALCDLKMKDFYPVVLRRILYDPAPAPRMTA